MSPSTLTPREKRLLKLRFGLIDGHERSVDSLARRFGVSPERIAEICDEAREKLHALGPDADIREVLA